MEIKNEKVMEISQRLYDQIMYSSDLFGLDRDDFLNVLASLCSFFSYNIISNCGHENRKDTKRMLVDNLNKTLAEYENNHELYLKEMAKKPEQR